MKRLLVLSMIFAAFFFLVACDSVEVTTSGETVADTSVETSIETIEVTDSEACSESIVVSDALEMTETESRVIDDTDSETLNETVTFNENVLDEFVEFLDREGLVIGLSQGQFLDLIGSYSVGGEPIDSDFGYFYDSEHGGGFEGNGEYEGKYFYFKNDFYQSEEKTTYSNVLDTEVPFGGLDLPFGAELGCDIDDFFAHIGVDRSSIKFSELIDLKMEKLLLEDENRQLYYVNLHANYDPVDYYAPFIIKFVEECEVITANGGVRVDRRTVMLYFSDFGGELCHVFISLVSEY